MEKLQLEEEKEEEEERTFPEFPYFILKEFPYTYELLCFTCSSNPPVTSQVVEDGREGEGGRRRRQCASYILVAVFHLNTIILAPIRCVPGPTS